MVFMAAVDFRRRLIAALFPSTTAIQTLDELRSLYEPTEEFTHPNTHPRYLDYAALN